jgi:hypothetical protein
MGPLAINLPATEGGVRLSERHFHLLDPYLEDVPTLTLMFRSCKLFERYNLGRFRKGPDANLRVSLRRL